METGTSPAEPPPPGLHSNLINPPSSTDISLVVLVLCIALTTPLVLLRIYTRAFMERKVWWDDGFAVIGWAGIFGHTALISEMNAHGGSRDIWNVSVANSMAFNWYYSVLEIVARVDILVTKVSILLMFCRCFFPANVRKTWVFWAIWGVIAFNVLYCIALSLSVALQCVGKHVPKGSQCLNQDDVLIIASIINCVSDIAVFVFPLYAVWGLNMAKEKKIKIFTLFATGFLAIAISVARLGWQIANMANGNTTQYLVTVALLALSEQAVGVIVSCMPVLPVFLRLRRGDRDIADRTAERPPRNRPTATLSTIARDFRDWRFRREEAEGSNSHEMNDSFTASRDNDGNTNKSREFLSRTDLGTGSSSATYNDDREKFARHVNIRSDDDIESNYPVGPAEPDSAWKHAGAEGEGHAFPHAY